MLGCLVCCRAGNCLGVCVLPGVMVLYIGCGCGKKGEGTSVMGGRGEGMQYPVSYPLMGYPMMPTKSGMKKINRVPTLMELVYLQPSNCI